MLGGGQKSSSAFIGHIQQFEYSGKGGYRARKRERKKEREKEREREREREREEKERERRIAFFFREGRYLQWGEDQRGGVKGRPSLVK